MTDSNKTRHIAILGISVALSLVLSYLELLIPPVVPVPGIKVGLANILILFLLYRLSPRDAAAVSAVRVVLSSLLFGTFVSFLYSIAGATVSFVVMYLLKRSDRFGVPGVSVAGAVSHNLAQIAVAAVLMQVKEIFLYLPVLTITGTLAGILIGAAGVATVKGIKRI